MSISNNLDDYINKLMSYYFMPPIPHEKKFRHIHVYRDNARFEINFEINYYDGKFDSLIITYEKHLECIKCGYVDEAYCKKMIDEPIIISSKYPIPVEEQYNEIKWELNYILHKAIVICGSHNMN